VGSYPFLFMKEEVDIQKIIMAHIQGKASKEELALLEKWVSSTTNAAHYKKLIQEHFILSFKAGSWNHKNEAALFFSYIEKDKSLFTNAKKVFFKYAATITLVLASVFYLFLLSNHNSFKENYNEENIVIALNSGEFFNLNSLKDTLLRDHRGTAVFEIIDSKLFQFKNNKFQSGDHMVWVPKGIKLSLFLADHSNITLNSASSLVFPSTFKNRTRSVYLSGEAYFDISKDINNPFIVGAKKFQTHVYGTQFNVFAYRDIKRSQVVLVEGSIGIKSSMFKDCEKENVLTPSQMASLHKNKMMDIENVNVRHYIDWRKGVLSFSNEPIESLFKILEREYNVQILNSSDQLNNLTFNGVFDNKSIDYILKTISTHTFFKYEKNENRIIITKPNSE
jgi:hypothetical protein